MAEAIKNRYDFVLIFDVKDGNPNGDPDAGNLPRLDAETGRGLVTDVSIKRKVRNYVAMTKGRDQDKSFVSQLRGADKRFEIYVREKAILNEQHERAYIGVGRSELLKGDDKKRKGGEGVESARDWMCRNFYDVRTFGAVMSLGINCGQVRGPIQITFARSVDPIVTLEHSITRMAVATAAEAEKQGGDNRTMGRKFTVPYGLYVAHGFVSSFLAKQTGFGEDDLELLWEALANMFEHDRSAARGEMSTRGLFVFKHESELGNAPAHALFSRVNAVKADGVAVPRSFADYKVTVNAKELPQGVSLEAKVS
ncbi:MAG: type I-C CRISPR-associated protein Cas7/Csd2 [Betaproteobacteria bacterium]|nr:type I-C CRISPR-associated protein Cas7/Csd2 [Betaproteobacteria bacterium]